MTRLRTAGLAAAVLALAAGPAMAQPAPKLYKPADANKDGKVTPEEEADYLARGAGKGPAIGVAAPKSNGDGVTFKLTEPESELDKRAVKASGFEEAQDAQARKAEQKKND